MSLHLLRTLWELSSVYGKLKIVQRNFECRTPWFDKTAKIKINNLGKMKVSAKPWIVKERDNDC